MPLTVKDVLGALAEMDLDTTIELNIIHPDGNGYRVACDEVATLTKSTNTERLQIALFCAFNVNPIASNPAGAPA